MIHFFQWFQFPCLPDFRKAAKSLNSEWSRQRGSCRSTHHKINNIECIIVLQNVKITTISMSTSHPGLSWTFTLMALIRGCLLTKFITISPLLHSVRKISPYLHFKSTWYSSSIVSSFHFSRSFFALNMKNEKYHLEILWCPGFVILIFKEILPYITH